MVFEILSKDTSKEWLYPMFTIEVVTDFEDKIYYHNDIHITTSSTGLIHFLQNKKDDANFDYKDFTKYCLSIEMIRGSINKVLLDSSFYIKETRTKYDAIRKEINDIVQIFVKKYNLILKQI